MPYPSAKFWFRSDGDRAFFSRQGRLSAVAVALFAVLGVTNVRGPGMGLVSVLLYTLAIANLRTPIKIKSWIRGETFRKGSYRRRFPG
jgi:hypothetical protein